MIRAYKIINNSKYNTILCSISGGSDSDIVLDICHKCDNDKKIIYIWYDTGLEYEATKEHLNYLEKNYSIKINCQKPSLPIPVSCKKYGVPFVSKMVSEFLYRLQKHQFQWEDGTLQELLEKYPKCKSALEWWCNDKGDESHFNIGRNKLLKEFILQNPPAFAISSKCCEYAKKKVAKQCIEQYQADLSIVGLRKFEGGIRSASYKNCFSEHLGGCDEYRPIWWYTNDDKKDYEEAFGIVHSRCYTEYGLKRTGCAGCPFGKNFEEELSVMEQFEPKLYKAAQNIFGESYEYMRRYREFKNK